MWGGEWDGARKFLVGNYSLSKAAKERGWAVGCCWWSRELGVLGDRVWVLLGGHGGSRSHVRSGVSGPRARVPALSIVARRQALIVPPGRW